ncbi:MAG: helix-turn-helix domain-containing protein [Gemmatimonadota bacterium]
MATNVRTARERLGLSQKDVALELEIARSAVSDIETGKRQVSAVELVGLARILGTSVERLLGDRGSSGASEVVQLRAASISTAARVQLQRWAMWCEDYQELEKMADDVRPPDLRASERVLSSFSQAHRMADEERKRLDLGQAPAHQLLAVLEEKVRVKVAFMDLEDSLSGASMVGAGFGAAIVVNRRHVAGRRVFTLAHEYFHLLTRDRVSQTRGGQPIHICEADVPGAAKDRAEQLADQFAGRLLMPPETFVEQLHNLRKDDGTIDRADLVSVARYFGVSVQAVFVQLAVQRLVPWDLARDAYADPSLQDRIEDYARAEGLEPSRFGRLAIRAWKSERISRARLAELLGVNFADVAAELARYGAQGEGGGVRLALPS